MAASHTLNGGGNPPAVIAWRFCPKDPFHWRTEGNQCPVCKTKIETRLYTEATL